MGEEGERREELEKQGEGGRGLQVRKEECIEVRKVGKVGWIEKKRREMEESGGRRMDEMRNGGGEMKI